MLQTSSPSLLHGGSCQTSLQRARGGRAALSRADPTFPLGRASRSLLGPRCWGFRLIPHMKMLGVILKPNTNRFLHTCFLLCMFGA